MTTTIDTTDQIKFKKAARIPEITFRKYRGEEDYEAMAWIINQANKADGNDGFATAEEIASNYAHLQRSDTDLDMIFAEHQGKAIGYGRCEWNKELDGPYLYSFFIHLHPDYRRDGIPQAMLAFLQSRAKEMSRQHTDDAPKFYQTYGDKGKSWHEKIMKELGFEPARYGFSMVRPCSQPVEVHSLPEGLEVRQVSPDDYRKLFTANSEAFKDHWGHVPPTEEDYQRFISWPHLSPDLWKVAWEGDQIVGMVLNFINPEENAAQNRKRGYTEDICVRRPWRRQGVARALLTQSIKMFQDMGMEETSLGVDTQNPNGALQLYESVGYREKHCFVTYRAPVD
jgi:ribosomal protein S18 acetylase RimI-like enzyme